MYQVLLNSRGGICAAFPSDNLHSLSALAHIPLPLPSRLALWGGDGFS
jgi:hypothetical protein